MGQLERYGLYVLCLVIFLILGVAIWGGNDPAHAAPPGGVLGPDQRLQSEKEKIENFEDFMEDKTQTTLQKHKLASADGRPKLDENIFRNADLGRSGGASEKLAGGDPSTAEAKNVSTGGISEPPPARTQTHEVKKGEVLGQISRRYYGTQTKWRQILAANPGVTEKNLRPGTLLAIPDLGSTKSKSAPPVSSGGRTYRVLQGDNPWEIARKHVGKARATDYALKILQANGIPVASAGKIKPGTVLSLPPF